MVSEVIQATVRLYQEQPEQAVLKPALKATSQGSQAVMEVGPYTLSCDTLPAFGGTNQAPSPTAFFLGALAGCAVVFIRDTLSPQLEVEVSQVEATATCEYDLRGLLGFSGVVNDFQNVQINVVIQSPEPEEKVRELFETWKKRCPILLGMLKSLPVVTTLDIKPSL
jgi:uncharacterized OsmC-like protein